MLMPRTPRFALAGFAPLLILACLPLGCGKKDAGTAGPAPATSPSAMASTSAAPPVAGSAVDNTGPLAPGESLMGRLDREAKSRPKVSPTADDVFAACDKLGAGVAQRQQSLAATYKASYCIGGYTPGNALAVNVCEYADEASASAGRDMSKKLFPTLATRGVWSHKAATLTIIQEKQDDATSALEKKIVAAFNAL
jgi:hypothetical protein